MSDSGWNMYVFRDGRKSVLGSELIDRLRHWLERMSGMANEDAVLGALIAAGELECALADSGAEHSGRAARITDALAAELIAGDRSNRQQLLESLSMIRAPETVSVAVAEGFAYYALHPLRFVEPVRQISTGAPVRVIGLRTIGTTLSAVVQAAFRANGVSAERMTVRPTGHPYDRKIELSAGEVQWLHQAGEDALVIIVDEGPGLSGSSFLSVAEAVEAAEVERGRIIMLGSRYPDVTQMRAPSAMQRWPRFRFSTASENLVLPRDASLDLTGGRWRHHFWEDFGEQPAAWSQLEPAKYMTPDRTAIYKFHGYGHFAESIAERARAAADAGFSPKLEEMSCGFGKYGLIDGKLPGIADLTPELLRRAAEYCAFRVSTMQVKDTSSAELETMAKWNWQSEFGTEISTIGLEVEHPVIADGRMLPHEWMGTDDGRILKLDSTTHGDDHFFPGPCDIAWDLAGMIVEWELDEKQATEFLEAYRAISGDDPNRRIGSYSLAYAIFRMAWSKMATRASEGMFDEKLLLRDYMKYRNRALTFGRVSQPSEAPERALAPPLKPAIVF
jgi:hypothetical protein